MITEIKNVRDKGNGEYLCTITLNGEEMEFSAVPGGGGYCDAVLEAIANGEHSGEIAQYQPPTLTQAQLLSALAAHRYATETGGIIVSGIPVLTDDRSKLMINGALAAAQRDENFTTKWKTPTGFVTLGAAQIIAVADAVAGHVNRCFSAESEVAVDIASYSTREQVIAAFDATMAE
jgi:hypothetical protein